MNDPVFLIKNAILNEDLESVKQLLPQIDKYMMMPSRIGRENLLCHALSMRSIDVFYYLATQIDVDYKYEYGGSILYGVINHQFLSIDELKYVLSQSKDINKKALTNGDTILHGFVGNICSRDMSPEDFDDCKNKLAIIIEHGADPFIRNYRGSSAIHLSLYHKNSIEILSILLKTKIDKYIEIDILNEVMRAGDRTHLFDVVELLLSFIKDINELHDGHSTLWYAKRYISTEIDIIELLEESGALPI